MIVVVETRKQTCLAIQATEDNFEEISSLYPHVFRMKDVAEDGTPLETYCKHYFIGVKDKDVWISYHSLEIGDWFVVIGSGFEILKEWEYILKYIESTAEIWPQKHLKTL